MPENLVLGMLHKRRGSGKLDITGECPHCAKIHIYPWTGEKDYMSARCDFGLGRFFLAPSPKWETQTYEHTGSARFVVRRKMK